MRPVLEKASIMAGLDSAALDLLWERCVENRFTSDQVVVAEGEISNRLFLIGEGAVRICKNHGQTNEVELARLGNHDFFGEMCILETLPRAATVQAVTDTSLLSISSMTFYQLYLAMPAQHSILVVNIARDLSRRLRRLDAQFAAKH